MSRGNVARPNRAVIDTGCLLNLLALHYVREARVPEPRRNELLKTCYARFDRNRELQEKYYAYFKRYTQLHTTSHVVGEFGGHIYTKKKILQANEVERFWSISVEYLRSKQFSEDLITVLELFEVSGIARLVPRIGVADTGLLQLAMKLKADLLTEDRGTLAGMASNWILNCIVVNEILMTY